MVAHLSCIFIPNIEANLISGLSNVTFLGLPLIRRNTSVILQPLRNNIVQWMSVSIRLNLFFHLRFRWSLLRMNLRIWSSLTYQMTSRHVLYLIQNTQSSKITSSHILNIIVYLLTMFIITGKHFNGIIRTIHTIGKPRVLPQYQILWKTTKVCQALSYLILMIDSLP